MNFKEFKIISQAGKEKKIHTSSVMYRWQRKISVIISWVLIKVFPRILPNYVSIANIALIYIIIAFSFIETRSNMLYIALLQLLLINFTGVMDKIDGEIARFKDYHTQKGVYYDLVYHFSYPLALYIIPGYFFYLASGNIKVLLFSVLVGLFLTVEIMARKSRQHIKYKILLEKNQDKIKDYLPERKKQKRPILPFRIINYFVFMIYDWTWCLFVVLILLADDFLYLAFYLFIFHLLISLALVLYKILFGYPKQALFTKEELR